MFYDEKIVSFPNNFKMFSVNDTKFAKRSILLLVNISNLSEFDAALSYDNSKLKFINAKNFFISKSDYKRINKMN